MNALRVDPIVGSSLAQEPAEYAPPSTKPGTVQTNLRTELQRLHVGTFTGNAGTYQQTTQITPAQRRILDQLKLAPPPRVLDLKPTS